MQTSFFLGANSKQGFFSLYDALIDESSARKVFIIKGSPGCGKSSFMRRVEQNIVSAGYAAEEIKCSSDPKSLDGVVFHEPGVALVDGTSPHVVEPKYPIAVESYLDLSVYADSSAIAEKKDEIVSLYKKYKGFYVRAYRLCGCAGILANEMFDIALSATDAEKLNKKARAIASREIKGAGNGAVEVPRFLSSISPDGYVTLFDTVGSLAERVYILEDTCGLASLVLNPIKEAALDSKYKVICCYSPLIPQRIEHLIIPELSLAFVTSNKKGMYPYPYTRRVRIDAMLNPETLKPKKQKLSFTGKLYSALIDEACLTLSEAKSAHDELEAVYNPHIDFDSIYALAGRVSDEILNK